jgi:ATPase subunit of ABC transporter with duplicated ATPase domains
MLSACYLLPVFQIEKFLAKNHNFDPSTMVGRQVHDKKLWSQRYYEKQVALAQKFSFPPPVPLQVMPNADGSMPPADDVTLIDLKDLRFSYNPAVENPVFIFNDPISFRVSSSTRVGVMGPNGAGKSTLLKLLTKKLVPTAGTVSHHPDFVLAYFGQHSTAELDLEKTPMVSRHAQTHTHIHTPRNSPRSCVSFHVIFSVVV